MKVLVFDNCLRLTGHRLHYAALVADAFACDHEVVLGLPDAIQREPQVVALSSRSFRTDFYPVSTNTKPIKGIKDTLFTALSARRCLIKMIKRYQPDLVAIPTADGLAILSGFLNLLPLPGLRGPKIDICVMRGPHRYANQPIRQAISNAKWWLVRRGPWNRIMMMDPREWSTAKKAIVNPERLCPDPVPKQKYFDRQRCRELLNLPLDGRIIVSVGPQNMRKGSDLLLKGFAAANLQQDDRLVMIGKISPDISPMIASLKQQPEFDQRLIVRDEFVSEDEFQMAIVASDVVAIPYRSVNRPSGIVCRSMAWQRPLVMTNRGWLKWILGEFGAGFGANSSDSTELGTTIKLALDQSSEFQTTDSAAQFINFNTEENFLKTWAYGVDSNSDSIAQTMTFLNHQPQQ